MATVAIYGGSFDPPHVGHVLAVSYARSVGWADEVLIVPVFEHAFDKDLTPFEDRLQLCRFAFGHLSGVELCEIERELPRPSYTLRTILALKQQRPNDEFRLLMGADAFAEMPKWHRSAELLRLAPPLVLGRVGVLEPGAPPPVLPGISSSQVRDWLHRRREPGILDLLERALPRDVLRELEARQLYEGG